MTGRDDPVTVLGPYSTEWTQCFATGPEVSAVSKRGLKNREYRCIGACPKYEGSMLERERPFLGNTNRRSLTAL